MTNTVIKPESYDFALCDGDNGKTLIGLRVNTPHGAVVIPLTSDDALSVGAMLIAHSDYVEQRPVRRWN